MFEIQSKTDSTPLTGFSTLSDVKWWFENICNIPWNWKVITPSGEVLDGKHYQSW